MDENVRAHVIISGKVQGVAFRYSTHDAAMRFGIAGWVKNNSDGTVEAVFEGKKENVNHLLKWCESGPGSAVVTDVSVAWEDYSGTFSRFEITY